MVEALLGGTLQCIVVTPERAVLDLAADFIALPMHDGELGILPGRAPFIGRLGYGELRVRKDGTTHRYFLDGGFAQVHANVVTVLTPRALRVEDLDIAAATRALETARQPAATPEAQAAHLRAQERARAQLHVAGRGRESAHA